MGHVSIFYAKSQSVTVNNMKFKFELTGRQISTYRDSLLILFCWDVFDFDLLLQVIHRVTQHQVVGSVHRR